jgi:hypothetical protein
MFDITHQFIIIINIFLDIQPLHIDLINEARNFMFRASLIVDFLKLPASILKTD